MAAIWFGIFVLMAGLFFALWLVAHNRTNRPLLILLEPLHWLTKSWQIARYIGAGSQVEAALRIMAATKTKEAEVEKIIPPLAGKLPKVALLDRRQLPLIGEQKLVEEGGKKFSYVVGVSSELLPQLILSPSEQNNLKDLEEKSGTHGFLMLAVGRTAVHGEAPKLESLQHVYLGAVLLEAQLDQKAVKTLKRLATQQKMLTVLPPALARYLAEKINAGETVCTTTMNEPAERFEQKVQTAAIIALASYDVRYRAIRALQLSHHCQFWSQREDDQKLPAKVVPSSTKS